MISLRSFLLSSVAALSVFAATIQPAAALVSTYTANGEVYKVVEYVSSDAEKVRVSTVLKGPGPRDTFAARPVSIPKSRFTSWFKPNLGSLVKKNLWWMGFAATIGASGWAIEELKGQVLKTAVGYRSGYVWYGSGTQKYFPTPNQALEWYCGTYYNKTECELDYTVTLNEATLKMYAENGEYFVINAMPCNASTSSVQSCTGAPATEPVSDDDLYDAIQAQLAADPAHAATAFTDPATGKGYADLFDPVPYIPGLSAADEALVSCYFSGQLQTVNSETACYVATQAEYDRVKQLAELLASGRTPEGEADALNSELKQPLTQAQYEETNKKYSDAVADVTADVNAKNDSDYSDIDDKFTELDGIITDLPNTALPAPADISVPQYVDCQQLHLSDGNGHELDFPNASQCAKIETFKQGFGYFLAISVVFLLGMQLLTRPHG